MMKKYFIAPLLIATLFSFKAIFSQTRNNNLPQSQPTEQQIERMKKEAKERQEEYVNDFIKTLEGDDFQKQIVRQYLDSYVQKKTALMKRQDYDTNKERLDWFTKLNETHFIDLEELISKSDYQKIQDFVNGKFSKTESKKKKKKKKKKNKDH